MTSNSVFVQEQIPSAGVSAGGDERRLSEVLVNRPDADALRWHSLTLDRGNSLRLEAERWQLAVEAANNHPQPVERLTLTSFEEFEDVVLLLGP